MHHLRWALTEVVSAVMGEFLDLGVDAGQASFKRILMKVSEVVVLMPDLVDTAA